MIEEPAKSHLLIGLETAAPEAGHRLRYTLASKLVNELVEAADDKQLSNRIAPAGRVDLFALPGRALVSSVADVIVFRLGGGPWTTSRLSLSI